MEQMLDRIRDRIVEKDSPIKSMKALSEAIGMSEGGFYMMFRKGTMKLRTKEAICDALNVSQTYFDNSTITNNKSDVDFGDTVLDKIMQDMHEMRQLFEDQLKAKDRQIEKLLDLLGKLEGANWNQLFQLTGDTEMDLMSSYKVAGFANNVLPALQDIFLPQSVTK
jgi:hypothetical protein